jgi:phage terminase large subunit
LSQRVTLPYQWTPRPYQRPLWDYLSRGGKRAVARWHRRSGKDDIFLNHVACAAHERVANYWYMLPQYSQARKSMWDAIDSKTGKRRIDAAFPPEIRDGDNDQEMKIRFKCGSTFQLVGSDSFNALVGSPPAGLVFSEYALSNPAAWAYLRPILLENGGWAGFNSTPRGRNHFKSLCDYAAKDPEWFYSTLTVDDTGVFTPEQMQAELQEMRAEHGYDFGTALWKQEYYVSFEAANIGSILGRWLNRAQEQGRLTTGVYDPDGADIEISSDIGFRDTASWWFWQPRKDGFGVVQHVKDSGMDASEWIDRLREIAKERGYRVGKIWLPHDARAATFGTRHSPMEQFLQAFGTEVVRVVPRTKILDRINAARVVIEHCWFDEELCDSGIEGLEAWQFEYDEERKEFSKDPKHDWSSHDGDGFSYGCQIMRERTIEKKDPLQAAREQMLRDEMAGMPAWTPEQCWEFTRKHMRGVSVGSNSATLDELWATVPQRERRI